MGLKMREKGVKEEEKGEKAVARRLERVGPSTLHVNWRTGVGAGSRRLIIGATETDRLLHTHTI